MTPVTELLKPAEAAVRLGVSVNTLEIWRCLKRYSLKYVKVGRLVYYRPGDIAEFLESRVVSPGQKPVRKRRQSAA